MRSLSNLGATIIFGVIFFEIFNSTNTIAFIVIGMVALGMLVAFIANAIKAISAS